MDKLNECSPPDSYYSRPLDWILESIDKKLIHQYYKEFYTQETLTFPKPKGLDPLRWPLEYSFPKAYVAVIPDGRIWGEKGFVITPNNKLIRDTLLVEDWDISLQENLPPITYSSKTTAVLTWPPQNNYFHWFFDILPQIHLLQESKIPIDQYVFFKLSQTFQYETLYKLKIPFTKIIQIDHSIHLRAKKLIIPSIPWHLGIYPKWTTEFLRKHFLDPQKIVKSKEFERIYISRDDASYRKVVNEDEVMNILKNKGFKKVTLSNMSFSQRVNIFSSAKIIIAPHGAGLTHLIFCNPGTKVIELFGNTFVSHLYWKISHYVHLDYYEMVCEIEKKPQKTLPILTNIIVDTNKLSRILKLAGV